MTAFGKAVAGKELPLSWIPDDNDARFLSRIRLPALMLFTALVLAAMAAIPRLQIDAGFEKMIPLSHPYMQTLLEYRNTFGGANRVLIALHHRDGDIYDPDFMRMLERVTDAVFYLPGIDRATVTSLFTPNVRFIEIIEEGFAGGNVIPAGFGFSSEELQTVRENVLKSGQVGRLVANDHSAALVSAVILEVDPLTGRRLDYRVMAQGLEAIRAEHESDAISLHIIGFAKAIGDIADGVRGVLVFFGISLVLTLLLLVLYLGSRRLAALVVLTALVPVVWLLGLLPLLGFGIDPMSILLPFLIFAIAVSHAVQMVHGWRLAVLEGRTSMGAAAAAFRRLVVPAMMALVTTAVGFLVILKIEIAMVRELALTAGLGVALILISNLLVLPLLLSWVQLPARQRQRSLQRAVAGDWLWQRLVWAADPQVARWILLLVGLSLVWAAWEARNLQIGDAGSGVPELRADARYNRDAALISDSFSIGVNVLSVIVQSQGHEGACTDHEIMSALDGFERAARGIDGVASVLGLAGLARAINAGWHEGDPRWRELSPNPVVLAQSVTPVDTASGLLDTSCDAMQIMLFLRDHDGPTLAHVVRELQRFGAQFGRDDLEFRLAAGNSGVMAATNEAVDAASWTILILVFGVIGLLFWGQFRSWRATVCILVPLAAVAVLSSALMALLGIGLKVATLPVIAIAVGIGVDYGIYLYECLERRRRAGEGLLDAYRVALRERGTAVLFTAATMSIGVGTWYFSALQFQADMGVLMAFMFIVNMIGALVLLPALAAFVLERGRSRSGTG